MLKLRVTEPAKAGSSDATGVHVRACMCGG